MALAAFANLKKGIDSFDSNLCWGLVQTILTTSGNLSKIFWPAYYKDRPDISKDYSLRGKYLRELLAVDKRRPLNSRKLRNYFEHYDERLHHWAEQSKHHILKRRNIIPEGFIQMSDPDQYADMGNLDPGTFTVTFWGDRFEIPVIIESIGELLNITQRKLAEKSPAFR
jgi:hypothetical protein